MILDVNDFKLTPNGRFLEQVSIAAGSTILTDSEGILRDTDVGKHIAIPGATELVARIGALVDQGDVKDVTIDGGSNRLIGTLFRHGEDGQPDTNLAFKAAVHVGQRITIPGAGPGGATLVTDVVGVINETTITLAATADKHVDSGTAILNRPDVVALDDYARHSVDTVTIILNGRTVNDGAMVVGGRALSSATAKFSSLDLGTEVKIRGAGVFVTTIASFQSRTQVTLAAPAQSSVTNGQADVWQPDLKTDSRPRFEELLAHLETLDVQAAEIRFGPGVYDFTRVPLDSRPLNAAVGLLGKRNLTIRGAGPGVTILRLMPQQNLGTANTHVIETQDCRGLTLSDLSVHGAYLTMAAANEQMHGVFLNEGTEDVIVERVRVFQSGGDGIRFLGRAPDSDREITEKKARNIRILNCQLIQNKRTGIAFQRELDTVWIQNCYIEMTPPSTDSCIDFEPSGNPHPDRLVVSPTDIIIDSNIIKHGTLAPAVSISGIGITDPTRRVKFTNNELSGGGMFCTDVNQLTIQNNTIRVTGPAKAQRIPIVVERGGAFIIISGNLLVNEDPVTRTVISLEAIAPSRVTAALVTNNLCITAAGNGIQCLSSQDVSVAGNMIVATGACGNGIAVRSEAMDVNNISIRDNDVTVAGAGKWTFGIHMAATDHHHVAGISIIGNAIRGATNGIGFDTFHDGRFLGTPVCALNQIGND